MHVPPSISVVYHTSLARSTLNPISEDSNHHEQLQGPLFPAIVETLRGNSDRKARGSRPWRLPPHFADFISAQRARGATLATHPKPTPHISCDGSLRSSVEIFVYGGYYPVGRKESHLWGDPRDNTSWFGVKNRFINAGEAGNVRG